MIDRPAITLLLGTFAVLVLLRVPITFCLAMAAILTGIYLSIPLEAIVKVMADGVMNFSLLAIPFFIIMGEIMNEGGISRRIVNLANLFVGRLPGGLALVNVLDSMFFGGISGSAVADVSSLGSIVIPMMKKQGYDDEFAVGLTVCSACQGIIIPPSHNMIIYAFAVGTASQLAGGSLLVLSVGKLFLGGYIPGILMGLTMLVIALVIAIRRKYPRGEGHTFKEAMVILLDGFLAMCTALIVVGGVVIGVFTATEAAAFAVIYAFIITFFVYREAPLLRFVKVLYSSLKTLAIVMSLIAAASAFGYLLSRLQVPRLTTEWLLSITDNYYLLLLLVNIMLLILGCIMDMAPLILICTPILFPVLVLKMGMDPVHFGIMLLMNLSIGLCTPPVGAALFVGSAVGKISIERASKGCIPFYISMLIALMLVTYIPAITMTLPNLFMPGK
ncbi:MAG: TRAP transporter large permease [Thermodesulfobacteriota bacterium]|nr:TRAP transporter large permease [Thermodesulfobacteriota bacterium]